MSRLSSKSYPRLVLNPEARGQDEADLVQSGTYRLVEHEVVIKLQMPSDMKKDQVEAFVREAIDSWSGQYPRFFRERGIKVLRMKRITKNERLP